MDLFVWNSVVREGALWVTDDSDRTTALADRQLHRPAQEGEDCSILGNDRAIQHTFVPSKCLSFEICAFCQIEKNLQGLLTLKGLCTNARVRAFDSKYHVYQYENRRLSIRFESCCIL